MTTTAPSHHIYVDEAGTPDIRPLSVLGSRRAYITCAVIIPIKVQKKVLDLLPNHNGNYLKSSDVNFTEEMAISFVTALLSLDVDIALILIDASDAENHEISKLAAAKSNNGRSIKHEPHIKPSSLMYSLLATEAAVNAIIGASIRNQLQIRSLDLTFDNANLSNLHRKELVDDLRQFSPKYELAFANVAWKSEQEQPLLLVPDLIAGIVHRRLISGGCVEAWEILWDAYNSQRISIQDGKEFHAL